MACREENGIVYITDYTQEDIEDSKLVMIGAIYKDEHPLERLSAVLGEEIKPVTFVSSQTFSNSAIIGKKIYSWEGIEKEHIFVDLYSSDQSLFFIVVADAVDYDLVSQIAETYSVTGV